MKCREVKLLYNKILPLITAEEKYSLEFQVRKASVSITANITEGYGKYHYQEGTQFYRILRGSLFELKDRLTSCYDFHFINSELFNEGKNLIESAKIILNGYIKIIHPVYMHISYCCGNIFRCKETATIFPFKKLFGLINFNNLIFIF